MEPSQHECLQQLPVIFYKAMKGIANLMDSFLGELMLVESKSLFYIPYHMKDCITSLTSVFYYVVE